MKRTIVLIFFAVLGGNAYAQSALQIVNNTDCDVTTILYANDIGGCGGTIYDYCGDLISNQVTILAHTSATYPDFVAFGSTVGWATETFVPCGGGSSFDPNFNWESAEFSFSNYPPFWTSTPAASAVFYTDFGSVGCGLCSCTGVVWTNGTNTLKASITLTSYWVLEFD